MLKLVSVYFTLSLLFIGQIYNLPQLYKLD